MRRWTIRCGAVLVVALLLAAPAAAQPGGIVNVPRPWFGSTGVARGSATIPAGSVLRIVMATPTAPVITQDASGTLAAGAYKVTVTAIDPAGGQTMYPTAATCTVTGGADDGCIATWTAVPGAASYRVWISDLNGATPVRYWSVGDYLLTTTITSLAMAGVVNPAVLPTSATAYHSSLGGATGWAGAAFRASNATIDASFTTGTLQVTHGDIGYASRGADQNSVYVGFGAGSGATAQAGSGDSVGIGFQALRGVTTGNDLTAVGLMALKANTTGNHNTAIGNISQTAGTIASDNVSLGWNTLPVNVGAYDNVEIGSSALKSLNSANGSLGYRNVAVGKETLYSNVTGLGNVAIGWDAGYYSLGDSNVFIGYNASAGIGVNGSNNVVIGTGAASTTAGTSNEITLGNASITNFRVPGIGLSASTTAFSYGGTFAATGFLVGATVGVDCASAGTVTSTKGIVTACSAPVATPEQLLQMVAELRGEIAALRVEITALRARQ